MALGTGEATPALPQPSKGLSFAWLTLVRHGSIPPKARSEAPRSDGLRRRLAARPCATSSLASSRSTRTRSWLPTWPGSGQVTPTVRTGLQTFSRVHGRPKETVENVSAFDDPLDVSQMTREERDALKRRLVAEHPDVARSLGLVREDVA